MEEKDGLKIEVKLQDYPPMPHLKHGATLWRAEATRRGQYVASQIGHTEEAALEALENDLHKRGLL